MTVSEAETDRFRELEISDRVSFNDFRLAVFTKFASSSLEETVLGVIRKLSSGQRVACCDGTRARTRSNATWVKRLFTRRERDS